MSTVTKPNHIRRKTSRIRELRDMKQEALGTNQQTISAIENSETIGHAKLIEIAKVLGITAEAIKSFSIHHNNKKPFLILDCTQKFRQIYN